MEARTASCRGWGGKNFAWMGIPRMWMAAIAPGNALPDRPHEGWRRWVVIVSHTRALHADPAPSACQTLALLVLPSCHNSPETPGVAQKRLLRGRGMKDGGMEADGPWGADAANPQFSCCRWYHQVPAWWQCLWAGTLVQVMHHAYVWADGAPELMPSLLQQRVKHRSGRSVDSSVWAPQSECTGGASRPVQAHYSKTAFFH